MLLKVESEIKKNNDTNRKIDQRLERTDSKKANRKIDQRLEITDSKKATTDNLRTYEILKVRLGLTENRKTIKKTKDAAHALKSGLELSGDKKAIEER